VWRVLFEKKTGAFMEPLFKALIFSILAGITIPLGALLAKIERIRPNWLEQEFRHSVIALGGGVLLAAVALVLVPEGIKRLDPILVMLAFGGGGFLFFLTDRWLARMGGNASQLMAMLLDFVPEAIALGALMAEGGNSGLLLAILIGLQNFPEGFNAYRELMFGGLFKSRSILVAFSGLVLLGPVAVFLGMEYGSSSPSAMGVIMLAASGGILYLTFQDIAPQAKLDRAWAPPLGAVAGFMVGLLGHMLVG